MSPELTAPTFGFGSSKLALQLSSLQWHVSIHRLPFVLFLQMSIPGSVWSLSVLQQLARFPSTRPAGRSHLYLVVLENNVAYFPVCFYTFHSAQNRLRQY